MDKEKLNDIICESSSDYDILNDAYNYIENLEQQCKKQKEVIDKAVEFINSIDLYSHEYALDSIEINDLLDILNEVLE